MEHFRMKGKFPIKGMSINATDFLLISGIIPVATYGEVA